MKSIYQIFLIAVYLHALVLFHSMFWTLYQKLYVYVCCIIIVVIIKFITLTLIALQLSLNSFNIVSIVSMCVCVCECELFYCQLLEISHNSTQKQATRNFIEQLCNLFIYRISTLKQLVLCMWYYYTYYYVHTTYSFHCTLYK